MDDNSNCISIHKTQILKSSASKQFKFILQILRIKSLCLDCILVKNIYRYKKNLQISDVCDDFEIKVKFVRQKV